MSIEKNMELLCLVARRKVIFHSTGMEMPLLRDRAVRSDMERPPGIVFIEKDQGISQSASGLAIRRASLYAMSKVRHVFAT